MAPVALPPVALPEPEAPAPSPEPEAPAPLVAVPPVAPEALPPVALPEPEAPAPSPEPEAPAPLVAVPPEAPVLPEAPEPEAVPPFAPALPVSPEALPFSLEEPLWDLPALLVGCPPLTDPIEPEASRAVPARRSYKKNLSLSNQDFCGSCLSMRGHEHAA